MEIYSLYAFITVQILVVDLCCHKQNERSYASSSIRSSQECRAASSREYQILKINHIQSIAFMEFNVRLTYSKAPIQLSRLINQRQNHCNILYCRLKLCEQLYKWELRTTSQSKSSNGGPTPLPPPPPPRPGPSYPPTLHCWERVYKAAKFTLQATTYLATEWTTPSKHLLC